MNRFSRIILSEPRHRVLWNYSLVDEFKGGKFLKKLVPLVTNGLMGEGMSGTRISME